MLVTVDEDGGEQVSSARRRKMPTLNVDKVVSSAKSSSIGIREKINDTVSDAADALIEKQARKVVDKIGDVLLSALTPPYMPDILVKATTTAHTKVWDSLLKPYLTDMIVREFGNEEKQMRREQITNWVAPPEWRTWMEQPIWEEKLFSLGRYLRAKFLYSTMPADGSIWKILRPSRPIGMCVYLAKLHSLTSVTAFGLTFLLMDRSDEYQLVAFILKFKAFQFLSFGLYPALVLGMGVMPCLMALDEGDSPRTSPPLLTTAWRRREGQASSR